MDKKKEKSNTPFLSTRNVLIFWVIVVILGFILGGMYVGIAMIVAAVLSMIIWKHTLNTSWEGTIEKIKTETRYGSDDSGYKQITYAYIKLNNGKTKKVRPYPDWKEGDHIIKNKGKMGPKKV